jgi:hypothetical protein
VRQQRVEQSVRAQVVPDALPDHGLQACTHDVCELTHTHTHEIPRARHVRSCP